LKAAPLPCLDPSGFELKQHRLICINSLRHCGL